MMRERDEERNHSVERGYSLWFRAAIIAVPLSAAVVLVVLSLLAVVYVFTGGLHRRRRRRRRQHQRHRSPRDDVITPGDDDVTPLESDTLNGRAVALRIPSAGDAWYCCRQQRHVTLSTSSHPESSYKQRYCCCCCRRCCSCYLIDSHSFKQPLDIRCSDVDEQNAGVHCLGVYRMCAGVHKHRADVTGRRSADASDEDRTVGFLNRCFRAPDDVAGVHRHAVCAGVHAAGRTDVRCVKCIGLCEKRFLDPRTKDAPPVYTTGSDCSTPVYTQAISFEANRSMYLT